MIIVLSVLLVFLFSGCATKTVRQQDLDAWKGVSVEALNTHSMFLAIPMVRTKTKSDIEIRNYVNKTNTTHCSSLVFGSSYDHIGNYSYFMSNSQYILFLDVQVVWQGVIISFILKMEK